MMPRGRQRSRTRLPSARRLSHRLLEALGPQDWWPARSAFEMMAGAILTQATAWHNVEHALANLRAARALSAHRVVQVPARRLERLIRPAGFFRQKAARLHAYARWYLQRCGADPRRMRRMACADLRGELLELPGIGPETADAIMGYVARQPIFVVDAYARRILSRHGLIDGRESYDEIQRRVMRQLPRDRHVLNEFHALLVETGKRFCHRRDPACRSCPLGRFPHHVEARGDG